MTSTSRCAHQQTDIWEGFLSFMFRKWQLQNKSQSPDISNTNFIRDKSEKRGFSQDFMHPGAAPCYSTHLPIFCILSQHDFRSQGIPYLIMIGPNGHIKLFIHPSFLIPNHTQPHITCALLE